ncbi:hypothetical protein QJS10_CPA06g01253 [Acorus calamus]|uniref:Small ribosomal subunit protein mS38 n=1 Tax=Acorus calamus TaxID=4465 RepID=A0AAV9EJD3_ACOCL|nr:hypothetical protein QJS10_CPA06g01253 [Acorus calamus]
MAAILRRILRKTPPSLKPIRPLSTLHPPNPPSPHLPLQTPVKPPTNDERIPPVHPPLIYPSFSFGCFLDPIRPTSSDDGGGVTGDEDDVDRTVWADSVKKKRKKKMNKHKYKKLRKRLRRQT